MSFSADNQGQTIIEVLIALVLMVLFLSGITVIELYSIRNVEYSRNKSIATSLARQQLERSRVVRDSAGITSLEICKIDACFINNHLTPVQAAPIGVYHQSLTISQSSGN